MKDLQGCAICLRTSVKLNCMSVGTLRKDYNSVSGLKTSKGNGLPEYLCIQCLAYVRRFKKFREKCHQSHFAMLELLQKNKEIDESILEAFDWKQIGITPCLSYSRLENVHYEMVKFKGLQHSCPLVDKREKIPIHHCSTIEPDIIFEVPVVPQEEKDVCNDLIKAEVETEKPTIEEESTHIDDDVFDGVETCEALPETVATVVEEDKDDNIEMLFASMFGMSSENNYDNLGNAINKTAKMKVQDEEENNGDGSQIQEEYATIIPLSVQEIKAVVDVYKLFGQGKHKCNNCKKPCYNEKSLKAHMRMHEKHISELFYCSLCNYYYKSEFLLKTHMSDIHMYKYICKKCPEVSYDKKSAKHHFILTHFRKGKKTDSNFNNANTRPSWLSNRGVKCRKEVLGPVQKRSQLPEDFPKLFPVPQLEQYNMIQERKHSKNYMESNFKCELCYRGFRDSSTYSNHMKKHDPSQSGELQCDMCKMYFQNTRKIYWHMHMCHTNKYVCRVCNYVTTSRSSAHIHYKYHNNVTFKCEHCNMVFNKISTRLTHIRVKHPSTFICELCGHSFVSDTGLDVHKRRSHTLAEVEASGAQGTDAAHALYCRECRIQFRSPAAFATHFGSSANHAKTNVSSKPVRTANETARRRGRVVAANDIVNNGMHTSNMCEICGETLRNDVAARKHYEAAHPGADYLKRYMCDICGHITKKYASLVVHMRTHTKEKPYACPHCERKFTMISSRDRHLVVHTGEKPYQCQHCNRRFTQKNGVKLHIQTVHPKIPYAPWDKKNRKRRKELENAGKPFAPPAVKYTPDGQGDYLSAYITYNDE